MTILTNVNHKPNFRIHHVLKPIKTVLHFISLSPKSLLAFDFEHHIPTMNGLLREMVPRKIFVSQYVKGERIQVLGNDTTRISLYYSVNI